MAAPAFPVFFCRLHALARSPQQVGGSKSRKISARFLTKQHGAYDAATRDATRTFSEGLRRSTVAHFARKVRGTNIEAAKHG